MNNENYGRLDIEVPEASYEAGSLSTVRILIRNPFDKPVDIYEIKGPQSSHIKHEKNTTEDSTSNHKHNWWEQLSSFFLSSTITHASLSFGGIAIEFPGGEKTLNIKAEKNSVINLTENLKLYDVVNLNAQEDAKITLINPETQPTEDVAPILNIKVHPHCETVIYLQISTSNWLFFTPTRQALSTEIRYSIEGQEKTQVITSEFAVKPPLRAMVIGSMTGAFLGTLAKQLTKLPSSSWESMAVSIGSSVVMSLIATIALSRKTGSQGFITVEDFFGGFVVGALIGYEGTHYFEQAILPTSEGNAVSPK